MIIGSGVRGWGGGGVEENLILSKDIAAGNLVEERVGDLTGRTGNHHTQGGLLRHAALE